MRGIFMFQAGTSLEGLCATVFTSKSIDDNSTGFNIHQSGEADAFPQTRMFTMKEEISSDPTDCLYFICGG